MGDGAGPLFPPRGLWDRVTSEVAYSSAALLTCSADGSLCDHQCRCYPWDSSDDGTIVDPARFKRRQVTVCCLVHNKVCCADCGSSRRSC